MRNTNLQMVDSLLYVGWENAYNIWLEPCLASHLEDLGMGKKHYQQKAALA